MTDSRDVPGREARTRSRPQRTGRGRSLPISRIYMLAAAVILAGAVFLFWRPGSEEPAGLGERISVVTAAGSLQTTAGSEAPRSGDVAIGEEVPALVPEQPGAREGRPLAAETAPAATASPGDRATAEPPATTAARQAARPTETKPTPSVSRRSAQAGERSRPTVPAPPALQPQETGGWAVQLGAFGNQLNADKLVAKLNKRGYATRLRTGNTSAGTMLHKVWIGYFATREEAVKYARQNRGKIGDGIPVHR